MQCANCGFYNMPGSAACGRCSTSLGLATATLAVSPPRASARTKRLRRVFPVRRVYHRVSDGLLSERFREATARHLPSVPPGPLLVRSVIPGWTHFYLKQPVRGHLFLWGWMFCLLMSLVLTGGTAGAIWFGLAFSVHASAISDWVMQTFADAGVRDRMVRGLAISAVLWVAVYWPVAYGIGRIAQPQTIDVAMPPFAVGDVVIVNHEAAPRVGSVVMFQVPDRTIDAGRIGGEHYRFIYTGDAIDRILAGPGDRVAFADGRLTVNGQPARWLPLNPLPAGKSVSFTVPPQHYLILPSGAVDLSRRLNASANSWKELGVIPAESIDGRVLFRSHPLSRFGIFW